MTRRRLDGPIVLLVFAAGYMAVSYDAVPRETLSAPRPGSQTTASTAGDVSQPVSTLSAEGRIGAPTARPTVPWTRRAEKLAMPAGSASVVGVERGAPLMPAVSERGFRAAGTLSARPSAIDAVSVSRQSRTPGAAWDGQPAGHGRPLPHRTHRELGRRCREVLMTLAPRMDGVGLDASELRHGEPLRKSGPWHSVIGAPE